MYQAIRVSFVAFRQDAQITLPWSSLMDQPPLLRPADP